MLREDGLPTRKPLRSTAPSQHPSLWTSPRHRSNIHPMETLVRRHPRCDTTSVSLSIQSAHLPPLTPATDPHLHCLPRGIHRGEHGLGRHVPAGVPPKVAGIQRVAPPALGLVGVGLRGHLRSGEVLEDAVLPSDAGIGKRLTYVRIKGHLRKGELEHSYCAVVSASDSCLLCTSFVLSCLHS